MCGIAGALFWNDVVVERGLEVVRPMTDALAHRGPDGSGVSACHHRATPHARAFFGHRRLAILDLSDRAAQPMTTADRRIWLTYNGEIFNFKVLRLELESLGFEFVSNSDTEVILHGYAAWGTDIIPRLEGMFAFGLWDAGTERLLLARDPLGIKPLYVFESSDGLFFASETRALLASGLVPRVLDRVALEQYLTYQSVPAPRTLIRNVRMVLPGTFATATVAGSMRQEPYWDLLSSRATVADDTSTAHPRLRAALESAAVDHLVSDVPVGMFLSGGIDSGALVSLVRSAGIVPHTFTVTFPNTAYDESLLARETAEHFGAVHTEVPVDERSAISGVVAALEAMDHPSGDGVNSFLVSRAVRGAGIKVALSGLGGDELFGGYPSFARLDRLAAYAPALGRSPRALRRAAAAAVRSFGHSVGSSKTAALLERDGSLAESFPILRQLFGEHERRALLPDEAVDTDDPYVGLLRRAVERHPDAGPMTLVSYAEARTYMHDVLLRDTDQMSMWHGLEVRVPLLDTRLVSLVMGLPDASKRPGTRPKQALVDSLPSALPASVLAEPKRGFVLPMADWMRDGLRPVCESHLMRHTASGLDDRAVRRLWTRFLAGDKRTSWSRPWSIVALHAWLDRHRIGNTQ